MIVVIGQAPSSRADFTKTLEKGPLVYLAHLVGWPTKRMAKHCVRWNLLPEHAGKAGKGDAFDVKRGRVAATKAKKLMAGRQVLFLGQTVAKCFGHKNFDFLMWYDDEHVMYQWACVPHPSGVNRWWNEYENRDAARTFIIKMLWEDMYAQSN